MQEQITQTEARLSEHEAVCAERYLGINGRLKRLEQIILGTAAFIIMTLLSIVLKIH